LEQLTFFSLIYLATEAVNFQQEFPGYIPTFFLSDESIACIYL
jgi:hypothetical protein